MFDVARMQYVTDPTDAVAWAQQLSRERILGVDIETYPAEGYLDTPKAALDPYRANIRLVQVAALDGRVIIFDLQHISLDSLISLTATKWVTFNGGFDYRHLTHAGMPVPPLHDTQLLDRLISHKMHRSLADVVKDTLGITLDKSAQMSDWSAPELSEQQLRYSAMDALATLRAAAALLPKVDRQGQRKLYDTWCAVLPVLSKLQLQGQRFDWDAHSGLADNWQTEQEQLLIELAQHLGKGVNPNSAPQIGKWLTDNLDSTVIKRWPRTPNGALRTNAETLALFASLDGIRPLLRYKTVAKLLSTYAKGYAKYRHPVTDRLHAEFQLGQTTSGRVCAAHPNTQNPPRLPEFRALFIPDPGMVFVGADFSQIELRVAALLSNDQVMLSAYHNGADLHLLTAATIAGIPPDHVTKEQRTAAKAVNFGNLYGQGPAGLAKTAKLDYGVDMTVEEAQRALVRFGLSYPQLAGWKRQQVGLANQFRQVKTRLGLIRDFTIQGEGYLRGEAQNIPVQGSAAEVLMCTLARLPTGLAHLDAQLVHNVHDEVLVQTSPGDADKAAAALKRAMVEGFLDVFPEGEALTADLVDVQIGNNWAEVH